MRTCICGAPGETYNICSGRPYTLQHVIDVLTRISGHQMDVVVNPAFVRASEVHRLCGSPGKLQTLLKQQGSVIQDLPIEDTLRRMLGASPNPTSQNLRAIS